MAKLESKQSPASASYSAVIRRDGKWRIGWVEEVPGVNSQARSRKQLVENLRSALREALELNRAEARIPDP